MKDLFVGKITNVCVQQLTGSNQTAYEITRYDLAPDNRCYLQLTKSDLIGGKVTKSRSHGKSKLIAGIGSKNVTKSFNPD